MAGALTRQEGCVAESVLIDFAAGRLSADATPALDAHLAACSVCMAAVSAWREQSLERSLGDGVIATRPSVTDGEVDSPLAPGTRVGRYVVLEEVGSGAMGTVYAAFDPDLDRRVALKMLRSRSTTEELRARLLREAKAMARITHPDVITVYDVGTRGARLFVAMEFVKGGTLRAWTTPDRGWRAILDKYVRAGRGLAFAHAAGVIHRDFKPDNVLVGADDRVRVTDFGLARALEEEAGAERSFPATGTDTAALHDTLTRTGAIVGTPAYMAPEQFVGAAATPSSDMFSFCVSLYEALYGERPFRGQSVAALRKSVATGKVQPSSRGPRVPARIRRVLLRGLRAVPQERHPSMAALLDALEAASRPVAPPALVGAVVVLAAVGAWRAYAQGRAGHASLLAASVAAPEVASSPITAAIDVLGASPGPSAVAGPPALPLSLAETAPASDAPSDASRPPTSSRAVSPGEPARPLTRRSAAKVMSVASPSAEPVTRIAPAAPVAAAPPTASAVRVGSHGVPILP